jgi:hypothetical protein
MRANLSLLLVILVSLTTGGCQAIVDIFQAGVWVGVIGVLVVVALIGFLVSKGRSRS